MAAWWSPLSDGIQRLVGRDRSDVPTARERPTESVPEAASTRPAQAWPWQPPVQRAIDPTFSPRLRPDDFAAGLSSHQDPSFRRDLVHEVRPSVGGLVDGLADLVPGQPRTLQRSSELTVRPVRHAQPAVQRSFASFATSGDVDGLTTVEVEPPWAAEPTDVVVQEPSAPLEHPSAEPDHAIEATPTTLPSPEPPPSPVATVPAATPRDIRVQRHATEAAPSGAADTPAVTPPAVPTPAVVALPVVPTVARASDGQRAPSPSSSSRPLVSPRTLPVSVTPPAPRPSPPDVQTVRSLPVLPPVLQRSAEAAASAPASAQDEPRPTTAPLSGFAQAIEQLAVQPQVEPTVEPPAERSTSSEDAVFGPVVSSPRTPTPDFAAADVQRQLAPVVPVVPLVPVAAPSVAPLVGSHQEAGSAARGSVDTPAIQRAADRELADLPVVTVAHEDRRGVGAEWDVPRLPIADTFTAAAPAALALPVSASSPSGSARQPVVARTLAETPGSPARFPVVARATEVPPTQTVPLTGARPTLQRSSAAPALDHVPVVQTAAQPLRFENVSVASSRRSFAAPEVPPTTRAGIHPELALQRSVRELPAVAPGLVGPGPQSFDPGPVLPDPRPLVPVPVAQPSDQRREDRPVQRLAAPAAPSAPARPSTVRALPFDQMFGGAADGAGSSVSGTAYDDPGWTSVDLPVVSEGAPTIQRAVEIDEVTTEPAAAATPAAAPEAAPTPAPAPAAAAPAAPGAAPAGADLDEMARRLFDPLSARLRAELWLDRERAGLVADARF